MTQKIYSFKLDNFENRGAGRKPLRTFTEFCDEFNIQPNKLMGMLSRLNGPKPLLRHSKKGALAKNSWYDPDEMRKWWRSINEH